MDIHTEIFRETDGQPQRGDPPDLEADQWQDRLNELIPPRFARLFLFDGEKIQNLVDDNAENVYLRDSFKSLLGLDIIDRLKTDLGMYLSQNLKGTESCGNRQKTGRDTVRN